MRRMNCSFLFFGLYSLFIFIYMFLAFLWVISFENFVYRFWTENTHSNVLVFRIVFTHNTYIHKFCSVFSACDRLVIVSHDIFHLVQHFLLSFALFRSLTLFLYLSFEVHFRMSSHFLMLFVALYNFPSYKTQNYL